MLGLFRKFKDGLAKTVAAIAQKTRGLFGGRKIDAASLEQLEEALYTADFGVETTGEILAEIKRAYARDPELQGRQAAEIGAAVLRRVLEGSEGRWESAAASTPRSPGHDRAHRGQRLRQDHLRRQARVALAAGRALGPPRGLRHVPRRGRGATPRVGHAP